MRSRRALRRALVALLAAVLAAIELHGWRWSTDRAGRRQYAAVVAHLDATDPRWRWEEIVADRPDVPEAENSVRLVVEFRRAVPDNPHFAGTLAGADYPFSPYTSPDPDTPNRRLDAEGDRRLDVALAGIEPGWPVICRLSECPRGRMCMLPAPRWRGPSVLKDERPDALFDCLHWESERLARGDDPDRQEILLRALLNLARIDGGLPRMLPSRMIRVADTARRAERLLALDRLGTGLGRLQSEFTAELAADHTRPALRDLRANRDRLFRAIASGDLSPAEFLEDPFPVRLWLYEPHFWADWAMCLDLPTRLLAIAELPESAQLDALAAIPAPDSWYRFSSGCLGTGQNILRQALATKALLRCTVAGLAAERHRVATGRWPESLATLPRNLLPAIPPDPYTGEPIRLVRRADGITIYAVGRDRQDDAGRLAPTLGRVEPGIDIGFRLYDPDQRRLPPLPPETEPQSGIE